MEVKNNLITTIPFKGVHVRVEFAGGNSMKNIPAKLYTRDPFVMKALDSSDQLGRLFYVHQVVKEEGDEDTQTIKTAAEPAGAAAAGRPVVSNNLAQGSVAKGKPEPKEQDPAAGSPDDSKDGEDGEGAGSGGDGKLEFENLGEAINYIATKYGVQVESAPQARKTIEEHEGKKVVIHNGQ